VQPAIETG